MRIRFFYKIRYFDFEEFEGNPIKEQVDMTNYFMLDGINQGWVNTIVKTYVTTSDSSLGLFGSSKTYDYYNIKFKYNYLTDSNFDRLGTK
jgi:hypothetical protein